SSVFPLALSHYHLSRSGAAMEREAIHEFMRIQACLSGDPGQRRRCPQPAGVEQSQRQDVLARALAEAVLLVEVAGTPSVNDPFVGVEAEPGLLHGLAAALDQSLE